MKPEHKAQMRYFDANVVRQVELDEASTFTAFAVEEGNAWSWYVTDSYDCGGLVELVMQARMRPAEFLPSLYVGKKAAPDDAPNSVQWSAQDREK